MKQIEIKTPERLGVFYGLETVSVCIAEIPKGKRNRVTVVGPFDRTPENIRYCNAIVDAARMELEHRAATMRACTA